MQSPMQDPHCSPPDRCSRRADLRRALVLGAALASFSALVSGCGAPPSDLLGDANSLHYDSDGRACYRQRETDPARCLDEASWSANSAMACAGKGLMLKNIEVGAGCGPGKFSAATYDCCTDMPTPTPMPPP